MWINTNYIARAVVQNNFNSSPYPAPNIKKLAGGGLVLNTLGAQQSKMNIGRGMNTATKAQAQTVAAHRPKCGCTACRRG